MYKASPKVTIMWLLLCLCTAGAELRAVGTNNELDQMTMAYYNSRPPRLKPDREIVDAIKQMKLAQGSPAVADQFPFAASLSVNGVHACGGVLVDSKVVLTAAHCVTNFQDNTLRRPRTMTVYVGNMERGEGSEYLVNQVVVPEVFNLEHNGFLGDIALLELSKNVNKTHAIISDTPTDQSILTAVGWGYTSENSVLSTWLQHALLTKLSDEECDQFHVVKNLGERPVDHFCAGDMSTGADTCRGDSGGPLLEGDSHLVGLTSYGSFDSKCGRVNTTGIYTSVEYWAPWINDTMILYNMEGESKPSRLIQPDFKTCWDMSKAENLLSGVLTKSVGECASDCRDESSCRSWQWEFSTGRCSMSSSKFLGKLVSDHCHTGEVLDY